MENIGLNRSREGKTFWFQVSSFFDERSGKAERQDSSQEFENRQRACSKRCRPFVVFGVGLRPQNLSLFVLPYCATIYFFEVKRKIFG